MQDNNRSIENDSCCRMGHESVEIEGASQLGIIGLYDNDNLAIGVFFNHYYYYCDVQLVVAVRKEF